MGEPSSTPAAAASTSTAENFFTERNCGYPGALRLADVLADPSMQRWLKREVKIIVSDKEQNKTSRPSKRKKMTDFQDFNDDSFEDGFDDSNLNDGHFFDNEGFDDAKDDVDQVEGDFYGDEEDADWGAFQPKVEMAEDLDMQVVDDYDEYFPEANVEIKSEKGDEEEMGVEEKVGASLKLRKVRKKGKPKVKKVEEDEEEDWADEWTDDWAEDWKDKAPRKKPGRKPGRRKVGTEEEEEDLAGDEFRARTCKLDSTSLDDYVIRFPSGAKRPGDNEDGKGDEGEERCKEEPNSDGEGGESKGEKAKEDGSVFVDKSKPENRRKTYACPFCVYSHKRKGVWVSHLKNRHSDKNIKFCQSLFHGQVCGFPYLKEETLKEHAKCHVRVPIECDICGKTFKMPSQMKQHRQIHMPKNTDPSKPATEHICSFCGKVFGSKTGYRQHEMMVHTKNFKYICDFEGCGKPFFDRTALNTHKNGHLGQSPYVCTYCGAGFAGKGLMKAHEKRVHGSEGEIVSIYLKSKAIILLKFYFPFYRMLLVPYATRVSGNKISKCTLGLSTKVWRNHGANIVVKNSQLKVLAIDMNSFTRISKNLLVASVGKHLFRRIICNSTRGHILERSLTRAISAGRDLC